MAPPRAPAPVEKKVQKRRRDSSESEEEEEACRAADGKKRRCAYDCYDDGGDDDEEMPPQLIKQEPKADEATEPIASNTQPGEQISPSVAALSMKDDLHSAKELSTPRTAAVAQAATSAAPSRASIASRLSTSATNRSPRPHRPLGRPNWEVPGKTGRAPSQPFWAD